MRATATVGAGGACALRGPTAIVALAPAAGFAGPRGERGACLTVAVGCAPSSRPPAWAQPPVGPLPARRRRPRGRRRPGQLRGGCAGVVHRVLGRPQRGRHHRAVAVALSRVLGQRHPDDLAQPRRNLVGERRGRLLEVADAELHGGAGLEGGLAREHLVQHHPGAVDVAGGRQRPAPRLLGGHVARGAAEQRRALSGVGLADAGHAEVPHLHTSGAVEQDVGRLDVAVDDPAGVGAAQRAAQLLGDAGCLREAGSPPGAGAPRGSLPRPARPRSRGRCWCGRSRRSARSRGRSRARAAGPPPGSARSRRRRRPTTA